MSAAALGIVAIWGTMQLGGADAAAIEEIQAAKPLEPAIEIAVTNSAEPEPSHAENRSDVSI